MSRNTHCATYHELVFLKLYLGRAGIAKKIDLKNVVIIKKFSMSVAPMSR